MSLPKIVVLTSRLPYPLDKGDKLRVYNQLRVLSDHFEVHLLCIAESAEHASAQELVKECCEQIYVFELSKQQSRKQVLLNIPAGLPLQVAYFHDRHIAKRISQLLWELQPSFIHCHLVRMASYCEEYNNCPKSIDYMDSLVLNDLAGQYLSSGVKSLFRSVERRRIKAYESSVAHSFDYRFVISERDRACFASDVQDTMALLHNGVDFVYYHDSQSLERSYDIAFCGNLGYVPNAKAVQFLTTQILPQLEKVTLVLAGADADKNVVFGESSNITMIGRVEDLRGVYQSAKMLVAPIFEGAGQQNKILEAMALGVPCITTSFVNESIGAMAGQQILLADDATSFARHIKDLLLHPQKQKTLSLNGRKFVEENFNWDNNTAPLVNTIKKALKIYE